MIPRKMDATNPVGNPNERAGDLADETPGNRAGTKDIHGTIRYEPDDGSGCRRGPRGDRREHDQALDPTARPRARRMSDSRSPSEKAALTLGASLEARGDIVGRDPAGDLAENSEHRKPQRGRWESAPERGRGGESRHRPGNRVADRRGPQGARREHDQDLDPYGTILREMEVRTADHKPSLKDAKAPGTPPAVVDETSHLQLPLTLRALTLAGMGAMAFEDAFAEGEEPLWFLHILDDGYELQRSGISMSLVADLVEAEVMLKDDRRYEAVGGPWVGVPEKEMAGRQPGRQTTEVGPAPPRLRPHLCGRCCRAIAEAMAIHAMPASCPKPCERRVPDIGGPCTCVMLR